MRWLLKFRTEPGIAEVQLRIFTLLAESKWKKIVENVSINYKA